MLPKDFLVNLDGFASPEDLESWASERARNPWLAVPEAWSAWHGYDGVVAWNLIQYARTKARAMRARISGTITDALNAESVCDCIYKRLPAWARW
jgi:hypothetical protein